MDEQTKLELKAMFQEVVNQSNHCQFAEKERTQLHELSALDVNVLKKVIDMHESATTNIVKGFVALIGLGMIALAGFGAWFKWASMVGFFKGGS